MAGAGLLVLLDDIAAVLDDVALMTKVAAKKTAGVLGDDLALNAQQVTGVRAEREIPVVLAVAKGSALNKLILVPAALLISAFIPWLITPLLVLGGAFLCFEGFEKVFHKWLPGHSEGDNSDRVQASDTASDSQIDWVAFEQEKIKGAIRTDFILSAEIVVIALGTVQHMDLITRIGTLATIAVLMTVGVYGLVAAIVKLDDLGIYLLGDEPGNASGFKPRLGRAILAFCPYLIKTLTIVGTAAMFLVGGGILLHGLPYMHDLEHIIRQWFVTWPFVGSWLGGVLLSAVLGILMGAIVTAVVMLVGGLRRRFA